MDVAYRHKYHQQINVNAQRVHRVLDQTIIELQCEQLNGIQLWDGLPRLTDFVGNEFADEAANRRIIREGHQIHWLQTKQGISQSIYH